MSTRKRISIKKDISNKAVFFLRRFQYGFVRDILNILSKYKLKTYLNNFLSDGIFPLKDKWKLIVNEAINRIQTEQWHIRINIDKDFRRFKLIHSEISVSRSLQAAKSSSEIYNSYLVLKLITDSGPLLSKIVL